MATEETQVFVQHVSNYKPLDENDALVYEKVDNSDSFSLIMFLFQYKNDINQKIHETFPSIPSDFDLKPESVFRMQGCGTFYHYKV